VERYVLRVFIADAAGASIQLPHPERGGAQPAGEGGSGGHACILPNRVRVYPAARARRDLRWANDDVRRVRMLASAPHPALPLPLRFAQGQRQGHPLSEGEGHSARALLPLGEEPALSDSERSEGGV